MASAFFFSLSFSYHPAVDFTLAASSNKPVMADLKVKVVAVHAMKSNKGRSIAPPILNHST